MLYHVSEEPCIVDYRLRPSKYTQNLERARTGLVPQ